MRYRKKPIVIEAIQFIDKGHDVLAISELMDEHLAIDYSVPDKPIIKISTLEGVMTADIGDYIIKGIQGEFYPCKPDIFEATYEKVEGGK